MREKKQIYSLVAVLFVMAIGGVLYKHVRLGFPLYPAKAATVWTVEAKIEFVAQGGDATVKLSIPSAHPSRRVVNYHQVSSGYSFQIHNHNGNRYAMWIHDNAKGEQTLYLRYQTFVGGVRALSATRTSKHHTPYFDEAETKAVKQVIETLALSDLKPLDATQALMQAMTAKTSPNALQLLLERRKRSEQKLQLAVDILTLAEFRATLAQGLYLDNEKRGQKSHRFIEIFADKKWHLYDPSARAVINPDKVMIVAQNSAPVLDVYGGKQSSVTFSTQKQSTQAFQAALAAQSQAKSTLLDLSIYSLPLASQNTFKLLLMIPLGALVVVILRNLVGIRTSGTFMPILLALSFMQTQLLPGIVLLLTVVSLGLILRYYLSHLNLLLVPRISAVVVFIIIIYAAIGIITYKLDLAWGLRVTFFPMIILAWTVERMSILWEEDGYHEVLIQGGGSLVTAILAYLLMSNAIIASMIFMYPELLLAVLAVIILIGTYTGYRLSDLRRFEPIERW